MKTFKIIGYLFTSSFLFFGCSPKSDFEGKWENDNMIITIEAADDTAYMVAPFYKIDYNPSYEEKLGLTHVRGIYDLSPDGRELKSTGSMPVTLKLENKDRLIDSYSKQALKRAD